MSPRATKELLGLDLPNLTISLIICTLGIFLNSLQIYIIRKGWKKVTFFEIVLLNLAVADLLASITSLCTVGVLTYFYENNMPLSSLVLSVFHMMVLFCVTTSVLFIVVIAIERLTAIKIPLKHRVWHSSKRKIARYLMATWVMHIVLSGISVTFILVFMKNNLITAVKIMRYLIGGYLCLGFLLAFVLYSWIAYLLLKRHSKFLTYDPKDTSNRATILEAIQKEKASIIVCILVVLTFMGFNILYVVKSFQGNVSALAVTLMVTNSVMNPLIYFFKGYIEKYFKKKKIKFSSAASGGDVIGKENHGCKTTV